MPKAQSASQFFGSMAASYDSLIRRCVPRYDEMTDRLFDYLPGNPARILELGTGTGNLTLKLANRFPHAAITTVDASHEMLEMTRRRLGDDSDRVRFIQARFEDVAFDDASFNIVTSCISLHHVEDKASLCRSIRRWLAPSGRFALADQCRGATDEIHMINWRLWIDFCLEPGRCSAQEMQEMLEHADAHDHYTPVREHFDLLRASGFDEQSLDCVWRNLIWAILIADAQR